MAVRDCTTISPLDKNAMQFFFASFFFVIRSLVLYLLASCCLFHAHSVRAPPTILSAKSRRLLYKRLFNYNLFCTFFLPCRRQRQQLPRKAARLWRTKLPTSMLLSALGR